MSPRPSVTLLDDALPRAKRAFSLRRVPTSAMATVLSGPIRPRSGDLVLAHVARLGHHKRLELASGRKAHLHPGDLILVAYADRYATDQFEAYVPRDLSTTNLAASGGIAGDVATRSVGTRQPTTITPVGIVGDADGRPLNVSHFALDDRPLTRRVPTICVIGTSMNAGKTTTIRHLVLGLARHGLNPGVTKVTGTGSGNDFWVMRDAGAHRMLDFTDAGMASTFCQPPARLERALSQLVAHLTDDDCDVVLVEIADGVFHHETRDLLLSDTFRDVVDTVVLAGGDAMGAAMGVQFLREHQLPVVAVSGALTKSRLTMRETDRATGLPVWDLGDLADAPRIGRALGVPVPLTSPPALELPEWAAGLEGLDESPVAELVGSA